MDFSDSVANFSGWFVEWHGWPVESTGLLRFMHSEVSPAVTGCPLGCSDTDSSS